jgi:AraC-like DNA-binding protein
MGWPALLRRLLRQPAPASRGQGRAVGAVQRAQHFMAERTADGHAARWTLNDVADASCCSLFHLARCFRQHTGLSLHGYRQRLRLAVALQRLEEGERELAALAHELGYSSQSHLGSVFARETGVTPAQARRALA